VLAGSWAPDSNSRSLLNSPDITGGIKCGFELAHASPSDAGNDAQAARVRDHLRLKMQAVTTTCSNLAPSNEEHMLRWSKTACVSLLLLLQGCTHSSRLITRTSVPSAPAYPRLLAVYEPWFGHPQHIAVGYSSQDPLQIRKQIDQAKARGISGFVVDWYGDREPFLDRSYALIQAAAAEKNFKVAMMYDESEGDATEATDDALAAFDKFNETYLAANAVGREAYLTYGNRPVIFIFPKGGHTDWTQVRTQTSKWNPPPLLIYEDRSTPYAASMDGFYAWVNPGEKGWAADGSNWGEDYLHGFYRRMQSKYPDKIAVGAAWPGFDDSKAAWGLNRHISQRCGKTFSDTLALAQENSLPEHPLPFVLIATWNDYEEGTAIEHGLADCKANSDGNSSGH
jgi:hypothetical protein